MSELIVTNLRILRMGKSVTHSGILWHFVWHFLSRQVELKCRLMGHRMRPYDALVGAHIVN